MQPVHKPSYMVQSQRLPSYMAHADTSRTIATRPAGQAGFVDSTFFRPCRTGETQAQCDARARAEQAAAASAVSDQVTTQARQTLANANQTGVTPATQQAIIGAAQTVATGGIAALGAAIRSGNDLEIARIQANARVDIERINQAANRATAEGNVAAAQQLAALSSQYQNALLQQQSQTSQIIYIVGGVALVGLAAAAFYFATRPSR